MLQTEEDIHVVFKSFHSLVYIYSSITRFKILTSHPGPLNTPKGVLCAAWE